MTRPQAHAEQASRYRADSADGGHGCPCGGSAVGTLAHHRAEHDVCGKQEVEHLTASARMAQPGLAAAASRPASAEPAPPALLEVPCWIWLSCCRFALLTTAGVSPVEAGMNSAPAIP